MALAMGSAPRESTFPENSRRAGTEDRVLESAREGRAPARPVEAASRRLGVFGKRPGGRFYFGVAELRPPAFELPSDIHRVYARGLTNEGSGDVANAALREFAGSQKIFAATR